MTGRGQQQQQQLSEIKEEVLENYISGLDNSLPEDSGLNLEKLDMSLVDIEIDGAKEQRKEAQLPERLKPRQIKTPGPIRKGSEQVTG